MPTTNNVYNLIRTIKQLHNLSNRYFIFTSLVGCKSSLGNCSYSRYSGKYWLARVLTHLSAGFRLLHLILLERAPNMLVAFLSASFDDLFELNRNIQHKIQLVMKPATASKVIEY